MAGKVGFEELVAWQKARDLSRAIYRLTSHEPFGRDRSLADQMRRASVSVMSNIAEGHERMSQAEFGRFLAIAKGSCAELRSQLYVALDAGYISEEDFKGASDVASEAARVIGGLRASVLRGPGGSS